MKDQKKHHALSLYGKRKLDMMAEDTDIRDWKFRDAQERFRRPAFEGTELEARRQDTQEKGI